MRPAVPNGTFSTYAYYAYHVLLDGRAQDIYLLLPCKDDIRGSIVDWDTAASSSPKMAFLGLTYLGPQDSFRVNMKKSGLLAAFKDDEFASAFDAVAGDARTLDAVLQLVYRGPPLECDRDRVRAHLDDDAPLTKDALLEAVRNARADERRWEEEQRDTVGDGSEFKLVKFYREHIARHQRMSREPAWKSTNESGYLWNGQCRVDGA